MESSQTSNDIKRLEIAGLYSLSFLGYIMHLVLHNLLSHGLDPKVLAETAEMMKQPSMQFMMFAFAVLTVAPAILAYILKGKTAWKILSIFALVVVLLNGVHAILHLAQGDWMNGGTTFVLQMVPGIPALIWSFKLSKTIEG